MEPVLASSITGIMSSRETTPEQPIISAFTLHHIPSVPREATLLKEGVGERYPAKAVQAVDPRPPRPAEAELLGPLYDEA